jgi:hypothetical protein
MAGIGDPHRQASDQSSLAPDRCEFRDCGQAPSRVSGEADAEGALDGFCPLRTMVKRERSTPTDELSRGERLTSWRPQESCVLGQATGVGPGPCDPASGTSSGLRSAPACGRYPRRAAHGAAVNWPSA